MSCFNCGYQAETIATLCPQCKRQLHTSSSIRVRGFLLMVCGGILVPFMGYISLWMVNAAANPNPGGAKFNGTNEQLLMIFGICGLVILFGLLAFVTGIFQAITGRRNKMIVWAIALLGALVYVAGGYFYWTSK
ncbi:hypothetical protein BH10ACI3_BH10ACI3_24140 [soil metagenome]